MPSQAMLSQAMSEVPLISKQLIAFLFLALYSHVGAYENLSVNIGGGYAGNLYADSFNIGNSYLQNGVALSSTNYDLIKFKFYYNLTYYEYDTNNDINSLFHVPGIALYRRQPGERLKWGVNLFAIIKDYTDKKFNMDNYRIFWTGDIGYYFKPGVQARAQYRGTSWKYMSYDNMSNTEHWLETEMTLTLASKTTLRTDLRYARREFTTDNKSFDWADGELGFSQSLDLKTGVGGSAMKRWSDGGTRPLSSYYIISGITAYWDPWDGYQMEAFVKRILPCAIVSKIEGGYYRRHFRYDAALQQEIPWLAGKDGRTDKGWLIHANLRRQFNLRGSANRSITVILDGGYQSNDSDEPFYKYNSLFANMNLEINLF